MSSAADEYLMRDKRVTTPSGDFMVATSAQVIGAALTDLIMSAVTIMWVMTVFEWTGIVVPEWINAVFGILIFTYTVLGHRNVVFSFGGWVNGLKRYPYSAVRGYSGKGVIFVVDDISRSTVSWRTVVLAFYIGLSVYFSTL